MLARGVRQRHGFYLAISLGLLALWPNNRAGAWGLGPPLRVQRSRFSVVNPPFEAQCFMQARHVVS